MKNRITNLFESKKDNILSVFYTAGFPTLESTSIVAESLANAGADIIEIGIPYSDPILRNFIAALISCAVLKHLKKSRSIS